ncbi:MAG: hypothetical protein IJ776_10135 [Paludibacteraceae bacterium]|nr:hypothetical protein [Paludibacteraceae bacterium]
MLITLIRDTFTPQETLGTLIVNGKPFCGTLEPPVVPNAFHPKGAIPMGWYKLTLTRSPKFNRLLPLLHYVIGFEGIRIHSGNKKEDTQGCILVGERSEKSNTLFNSRATEQALVELLKPYQDDHHEIYIEVTDTERYIIDRLPYPVPYTFHSSNK